MNRTAAAGAAVVMLASVGACAGSGADVATAGPDAASMTAAQLVEAADQWAAVYARHDLVYRLLDPDLALEAARTVDRSIYVAAPMFGLDQEVMELSPVLEPLTVVGLADSDVVAIAQDGDELRAMNTGCPSDNSGHAYCASLVHVTPQGMLPDLGTPGFRLDVHALWFDSDGQGFWADRYVDTPCDDGVHACGLADADAGPLDSVVDCELVHYRGGALVWDWSALEHVPDDVLDQATQTAVYSADDPFHCNSVQYDEADDVVYVSMRHVSSVLAIDRGSGDVLWTFGAYGGPGSLAIDDPAHLLGDRQVLSGNHDVHWLGGDEFSVFDNGTAVGPARVVVFTVRDGTATITHVMQDPDGVASSCTGSGRPIDADQRFWAVSWGCSTSGVSVVTVDGTPVARLTVDTERALADGLLEEPAASLDFLAPTVSYQAVVLDRGLLD